RHAGRAEQRQRLEVGDRVVRQVGIEDLVGAVGALRAELDGVAVGRRLGGEVAADGAGGPPLFSITMPGFHTSPSLAARTRDSVSVGPPGGNGTIQWIGRPGYSSSATTGPTGLRT